MAMVFGGSIRFGTTDSRSGEYPESSSYPAHLKNGGTVEPVDPADPSRTFQVEIALPNGRRLIVPTRVEMQALARILSVVDGQ